MRVRPGQELASASISIRCSRERIAAYQKAADHSQRKTAGKGNRSQWIIASLDKAAKKPGLEVLKLSSILRKNSGSYLYLKVPPSKRAAYQKAASQTLGNLTEWVIQVLDNETEKSLQL